jgi:hypothetical protein
VFRAGRLVEALARRDRSEIVRLIGERRVVAREDPAYPQLALSEWLDTAEAPESEIRRLADTPGRMQTYVGRVNLVLWSVYYGHPGLGFVYFKEAFNSRIDAAWLWQSALRDMRKLPEFKDFLQQRGYVAYWREFGWGDFCRPTVGEDFDCE